MLGILLFFPVRKFILAMSMNRQAAKLKRALTDEEQENIRRKVSIATAAITITFAFIYNKLVLFKFYGPPS